MDPAIGERRRAPRRAPRPGSECARLRPGRTALLIDISAGGALIESATRLLPGTRVELRLFGLHADQHITARVLRCHVVSLDRERVRYRGAVKFEYQLPEWVENAQRAATFITRALSMEASFDL